MAESQAGKATTYIVIDRWTNPQLAGDDGHDGAREECDWTWGKNIGEFCRIVGSWMFIVGYVTSSYPC